MICWEDMFYIDEVEDREGVVELLLKDILGHDQTEGESRKVISDEGAVKCRQ